MAGEDMLATNLLGGLLSGPALTCGRRWTQALPQCFAWTRRSKTTATKTLRTTTKAGQKAHRTASSLRAKKGGPDD